jgi:hypothetical protein
MVTKLKKIFIIKISQKGLTFLLENGTIQNSQ